MASNYDDVLAQLQSAGLLVDRLDTGSMRRCRVEGGDKEKRGWYMLHELRTDDDHDIIVGSFGVWRGSENNTTKVELHKTQLSADQRDALRKRLSEDKRRSEQARRADADRAAKKAQLAWAKCVETGSSDYLTRKGVHAHGVRFSPQGAMVIPMCDAAGTVHGLQILRGRKLQGQASTPKALEKEFWPAGLAKKGKWHQIGGVPNPVMLVAEGYATAASLFEATGLPVAVAFDAGNILPVAEALRKRYRHAKILLCADDDTTQRCQQEGCRQRIWLADGPCSHCGQPHKAGNAGISAASAAAMYVGGAWVAPQFADEAARRTAWLDKGRKLNDYNDLHLADGLHTVRAQIETRLMALGWRLAGPAVRVQQTQGGGEGGAAGPLRPIETLDELLERYALVYGQGGTVFDHQEHCLVALSDMRDACTSRELHRTWAEHPGKQMVRVTEVGFDPACTDSDIYCNLWAGWPTTPKSGRCEYLLDLLHYMCAGDPNPETLYQWVLRWLALPIQKPGAKLKTTLVIHGPQGTGKNMFFEAIMAIYGRYGRVIDQTAIEDKFNDWASRRLFLIADEVVARSDLYHVKNKLKAFITGDWIRINPKNMAAYDERNHVNLVFLSNEAMPVVLEEDDRRHAVIWTPEKLSADFYKGVYAEIEAGGVAALHHHLLHLDLGEFTESSHPPMTDAKRELIGLSIDSPSRFVLAFEAGDVSGFPARNAPKLLTPATAQDLYELYTIWCRSVGLKSLNQPRFANALMRKHGAKVERKRYDAGTGTRGPHSITYMPGGHELPPGESESIWLGIRIDVFRTALKDYKSGVSQGVLG